MKGVLFVGLLAILLIAGSIDVDAQVSSSFTTVYQDFLSRYNQSNTLDRAFYTFFNATRLNATWLDFDGVSDWAYVQDSDNFSINQSGNGLTVSFWVNFDALNFSNSEGDGYVNYLGKGYNTEWEWYFRIYNQSHATRPSRMSVYVFNKSGGAGVGSYVQEAISIDEWMHITAWWNGSHVALYKNGVQRDIDAYSASIYPENSISNLTIGAMNFESAEVSYLEGGIDDVRIFNRVLPNWEIRELLNESIYSAAKNGQRIPILSYHQVRDDANPETVVNTTDFQGQMEYLSSVGATPITFGQYYNWTQGLFAMPEYPVLITFDDGFQNVYDNARPIMNNYSSTGTLGIITDRVGEDSNRMNWTIIQEMANAGWEIVSHSNGSSQLTTLSVAQRAYAFNSSRQAIIGNLSITPLTFIYPGNAHNSTIDAECTTYYTMCTGEASGDTSPFFTYKDSDLTGDLDRAIIDNETGFGLDFQRIVYPEGQVLQLKFDENNGTVLTDTSDDAITHTGTIVNGTWANDGARILLNDVEFNAAGSAFVFLDAYYDASQIRVTYNYNAVVNNICDSTSDGITGLADNMTLVAIAMGAVLVMSLLVFNKAGVSVASFSIGRIPLIAAVGIFIAILILLAIGADISNTVTTTGLGC